MANMLANICRYDFTSCICSLSLAHNPFHHLSSCCWLHHRIYHFFSPFLGARRVVYRAFISFWVICFTQYKKLNMTWNHYLLFKDAAGYRCSYQRGAASPLPVPHVSCSKDFCCSEKAVMGANVHISFGASEVLGHLYWMKIPFFGVKSPTNRGTQSESELISFIWLRFFMWPL